ncbi:MAG TPA: hypothetical protein VEU33_30690 [Archangium sp.]|nr:hypothetical protein [Archangium sp.]
MRLKTPLALSLALLLGTASGVTEAAPRRGSSASARKAKKAPAAEQRSPAAEPTGTPASAETTPAADAPVAPQPVAPQTTLAPDPAAPVEPLPVNAAPVPQPAPPTWAGGVAGLAVPSKPDATPSAARVDTGVSAALGAQTDVRLVDLGALFPPPPPASLRQGDALSDEGKGRSATPGLAAVRSLAANVSTSRALTSDTLPPGVAELGEKLGARYVVLARVEQDRRGRAEAVLYAWDVQLKNRLRGVKLNAEDPRSREDAVRQVHAFLTGQHVPGPSLPVVLPVVMKKPWFWAAVGGVAAATTAGILLASQPQKPLGVRLGNFGAGW